jgi:hypothetical protein
VTLTATYQAASRTTSLLVSPNGTGPLAQDSGFPTSNVFGWTTGSKTFSFTTPGSSRLVVVAISYANYQAATITTHTVSGGGLTWTKAREALADGNSTFVSLWYAWVPAAGTYTATFDPVSTVRYDGFLTVHSFSGSSSTGIGAGSAATGARTLPGVGPVATTGTSAYLLAVGYADSATAPTVDAASTRTALNSSAGPQFWTQRTTATVAPGSYSTGLTAPATPTSWAMAVVEVRAP